jgi:AIG2 family protein
MDVEILRARGVGVIDSQLARLHDYRLRIGARATLVPAQGQIVHGVLMRVSAEDLERLYSDPSVSAYIPQAVEVIAIDGKRIAATCYNLPESVKDFLANQAYAQKLHDLALKLGLPAEYLESIERAGSGT